jgi:hypothetical protein
MNPDLIQEDVELLRSVLTRLLAARVSPDGKLLEQHEGSVMTCLGTLMFIASDLRESRVTASKKLRVVT